MTQPDSSDTQRIEPRRDPYVIHDRGTFERVLRAIREIVSIVALVLASILMVLLLATIGAIGQRLSDTSQQVDVPVPEQPVPAWTCGPTGEDPC